jgi:hypothetical protein
MINIKMPKIERATKKKLIFSALAILGFLTMICAFAVKVALWFDSNKVIVKSPLVVSTQKVITVEKRVIEVISPIVVMDYPEEVDTDIEKYICEKWGLMDCKMALAVAKAESGLKCDALNINTNGTVDLGVFQLNTTHLKKGGDWNLANMGDCYKNVDLAHQLWTEQGWNPWVAYLSGSYLSKY